MPAFKGSGTVGPEPHKHPIFLPHKQNVSNAGALSPIINIGGPRSLMVNSSYAKQLDVGISHGNYKHGPILTQQHHSYIPTNLANNHNMSKSGNNNKRGGTVLNRNGMPFYRQASATSLISTKTKNTNCHDWKMSLNSTNTMDAKICARTETQRPSDGSLNSEVSGNPHKSHLQRCSDKPKTCENKVNFYFLTE